MIESYQWLLERTRQNQLKYSRGYAILGRMKDTLEVMKQKKKELVKPTKVKQTQIQSNISYFLSIITQK